jgi:hypothetical protein
MNALRRPQQQCYVIKKSFCESLFTIHRDNDKLAVVAFKTRHQAGTFKRLYQDIEIGDNHRRRRSVVVERMSLEFLMNTCCRTSLDLMIMDDDGNYRVYEAMTSDEIDDSIRMVLENKYRYYG